MDEDKERKQKTDRKKNQLNVKLQHDIGPAFVYRPLAILKHGKEMENKLPLTLSISLSPYRYTHTYGKEGDASVLNNAHAHTNEHSHFHTQLYVNKSPRGGRVGSDFLLILRIVFITPTPASLLAASF